MKIDMQKLFDKSLTVLLWLCIPILAVQIVRWRLVDVCMVPTDSMENAIMAGDRLAIHKTQDICRYDVIVFNHPDGGGLQLVKRCIGLPGDTVSIVRGAVYINGNAGNAITTVRKCPWDFSIDFPLHSLQWDINNYGPVVTPAKGLIVPLDSANMNLYRYMIQAEGHEVSCRDGVFYIDNQTVKDYTFCNNGYFVLGDNRGNSSDSRYWGTVPEEMIVGKALMVYFSRDENRRSIRWERIGRMIE